MATPKLPFDALPLPGLPRPSAGAVGAEHAASATNAALCPPALAIRTQVADPALRAYIRSHPFLTGPDLRANRRALAAVRAGTRATLATRAGHVEQPAVGEQRLPPEQQQAALALLRRAGLGTAAAEAACNEHAWRVALLPADARDLLCLCNGDGEELALVRARAPRARLLALTHPAAGRQSLSLSLSPLSLSLLQATAAEPIAGPDTACLQGLLETLQWQGCFDAVFCNRALEHLFDPDRVLQLLARSLRPGGVLVTGLTLDADPSTPLCRPLMQLCVRPRELHALDMGLFDPGRPWKTNAADLSETLERAGLGAIRVQQRARLGHARRAAVWGAAYVAVFGVARAALRALFPVAPYWVSRSFAAMERHAPFGANWLKKRCATEVVARAVKPAR